MANSRTIPEKMKELLGTGKEVTVYVDGTERTFDFAGILDYVLDTLVAGTGVTTVTSTAVVTDALTVDGTTNTVVILANLPTADPAVAGQLWNNAGTLTISVG